MGDFEDKVNNLLSTPEGIEQILTVARMLSSQSGPPPDPPAFEGAPPPHYGETPPPSGGDMSQILSALQGLGGKGGLGGLSGLGNLDPKIMNTVVSLLGEVNSPNDKSAALLLALRPYLKEDRQPKIERALQIAKLVRVGKRFFTGLNGGKEDV